MPEETITIPLEEYERLKAYKPPILFGKNNGELSDEELETKAVNAALAAASIPVDWFNPIQQACWAYMQTYVDYVPF